MALTDSEAAEIQSHCDKFKKCAGCPFVAGKCVAPVGDHGFNDWLQSMLSEIRRLNHGADDVK